MMITSPFLYALTMTTPSRSADRLPVELFGPLHAPQQHLQTHHSNSSNTRAAKAIQPSMNSCRNWQEFVVAPKLSPKA